MERASDRAMGREKKITDKITTFTSLTHIFLAMIRACLLPAHLVLHFARFFYDFTFRRGCMLGAYFTQYSLCMRMYGMCVTLFTEKKSTNGKIVTQLEL